LIQKTRSPVRVGLLGVPGEEWVLKEANIWAAKSRLRLSPALGRLPGVSAFKAVYRAGYGCGKVPPDLASAGLELAAWNMARYKGRFYRGSDYQPFHR
jgi:hypothetical protein